MTNTSKLKLVGKGTFTRAYLRPDNMVQLDSCCPIKEVIALDWFPDTPLFPKMEKLGQARREGYYLYLMEYYPKPTGGLKKNLDPDQYAIYQELRRLEHHPLNGYRDIVKAFQHIKDEQLRETMLDAATASSNVGEDIAFEISPRNVAVKDGKLILLDVFYNISMCAKVHGYNRFVYLYS